MQSVHVNGVDLAFDVSGPEDAPVLLFLHCLGASRRIWTPQREALFGRFRVLAPDLRGHGDSSVPPGPWDFPDFARDVIGLLDALAIERCHVVGLSIGGMIAQELLLTYPERLITATLAATRGQAPDGDAPDPLVGQVRAGGMPAVVEATLGRWFTEDFRARAPASVDAVRQQILACPPEGYLQARESLRRCAFLARLGAVITPVLILVGRQDQGTPVAAAAELHAAIPRSELAVIDQAAHLLNQEQPEPFTAAIEAFVDRFPG